MPFTPIATTSKKGSFTPLSEQAPRAKPSLAVGGLSADTISHGGVSLSARMGNFLGNTVSSITQPFVSLAAVPVQAGVKIANKITGGQTPDPYAEGVPGLGDKNIDVTPLTIKRKAGDVIKAAGEIGAVASAPASIPGAIIAGAGVGASQGAGGALQENAPIDEVARRGVVGGIIGGAVGGLVSGIGALLGKMGDKIMTSVIRPTKNDIEDGFTLEAVKKYNLGGSLNKTLEKTQTKISQLSGELGEKLQASESRVDLKGVVDDTIRELTDSSKLKGFGANTKILSVLDSLKSEVSIVGSDLTIPEAQIVKQASGGFGAWQYGKPDPDSKAVEIVYNTFYRKLKEAIEYGSPEGVREINREISQLIPILNAVIRRLPVAERNNLISLSDMVGLVGSSMNPIALGPTLINLISKSGTAGNLLSKFGPKFARGAVPASFVGAAVIDQPVQQE